MNNAIMETLIEFPTCDALVDLSPEILTQAEQWSNSGADPDQQWARYEQALALLSCQAWLTEQAPTLNITPAARGVLTHLQVGNFRIGILPSPSWSDPDVSLPAVLVADPAHFYVRVGISLDTDLAAIQGFLRYDEVIALPNSLCDAHNNRIIPLSALNPSADALLLQLECLAPSAIALPSVNTVALPDLITPVINVCAWLNRQVDAVNETLGWVSLTAPAFRDGERPRRIEPVDPLNAILNEIKAKTGLHIPRRAYRAYRDLDPVAEQLRENSDQRHYNPVARLYAIVWPLPEPGQWSLLLILGAPLSQEPPQGLKLQVSDPTQMLLEEELQAKTAYVFAQIEAAVSERLMVTVAFPTDDPPISVPFIYSIEKSL